MMASTSHPARSAWRRPSLPLVLGIALALIVALLALGDRWLMHLEIRQSADQAVQRLGAYQTSLQTTIDRHSYLPRILAADPRIVGALQALPDRGADPTRLSRLLASINIQAGSDEIFLLDPQGLTHWSSNYQSDTSFVGSNYGFRPYFRSARDGVPGLYFAVGATSGKPGLFLSAPVTDDGGSVLGVIAVKIDLGPLERSWAASGDSVWVTDREGIVFLSSSPRWHYRATRPISAEHRQRLAETRQYGDAPVERLESVADWQGDGWASYDLGDAGRQIAFASPIRDYPWRMHLRRPFSEIRLQVRLKQALVLLLGAAAAGGALYYRERHRRTEAQRAIGRLTAEREHHQRAIIQNTDAGLLNLDAGFQPIFINEQARQYFALGDGEVQPRPQRLITPWQPRMAGQGPCRAEGVRTDGSRFPILYTLNPIRVGQQDEYILTVQDVTELTAAQQALQDANAELEARVEARTRDLQQAQAALAQNQKLAALGRMSSAIAHEINQPITALGNYVASSRLLLERGRAETVGQNLARIEGLVDRLSALSRQLRVFSGKRNTGSAPVSLHGPVHYALDLLGPRLEQTGVDVELVLGGDRRVQANTMMLEQILVNLVGNAVDALAGRSDGQVRIRLDQRDGEAHPLQLTISDNGPGLDPDALAQVFEPFYSTKPVGDGMGLGLAISYSLARDLGAELSAHSEPGRGTTFTLAFPAASLVDSEATS